MIKQVTATFSASIITITVGLLISMSTQAIASNNCGHLKGCEKKFCEIESQLKIAHEKGNKNKADGLKKAIDEAKEHCTDKRLKEELVKEIDKIKDEITEYESDLKEAKKYGKTDKIRKYHGKIEDEKNKINQLENELSNLD